MDKSNDIWYFYVDVITYEYLESRSWFSYFLLKHYRFYSSNAEEGVILIS